MNTIDRALLAAVVALVCAVALAECSASGSRAECQQSGGEIVRNARGISQCKVAKD